MPENQEVKRNCIIVNKHGLHTRSAAAIVALACQFQCKMKLITQKGESDTQDMLRLMLLEASKGTEIIVSATGIDAVEAVDSMATFINAGFDELDE